MTNQNYEMALTEVDEILSNTDIQLVNKIPIAFRNLIKENKSKDYKPSIDKNKPIDQQNLLKETEAILSLIFISYWATDEEKIELQEKDEKEYEELKRKTEIVFKADKEEQIQEEVVSLAVKKEIPWYKKIYNKILKLFKRQ